MVPVINVLFDSSLETLREYHLDLDLFFMNPERGVVKSSLRRRGSEALAGASCLSKSSCRGGPNFSPITHSQFCSLAGVRTHTFGISLSKVAAPFQYQCFFMFFPPFSIGRSL